MLLEWGRSGNGCSMITSESEETHENVSQEGERDALWADSHEYEAEVTV
jgi:hypothetical protein